MANNDYIFNGVVCGYAGGSTQSAIEDIQASDYADRSPIANALATAIDNLIPNDPSIGTPNADLMQSIVEGYFSGRFPEFIDSAEYLHAARAIVALYTALAPSLIPVISGGGMTFFLQEFTASEGQTDFILTHTPTPSAIVLGYVNGVLYRQGSDYTFVGDTFTWSDNFTLIDNDVVQVYYPYIP